MWQKVVNCQTVYPLGFLGNNVLHFSEVLLNPKV